jgi:hypothetical protein
MRQKMIRLLVLAGLVCLFAVAGRALAIYLFYEFIFDMNRGGERNVQIRLLCHIGGILTGGAIGVKIHRLLFRGSPGE